MTANEILNGKALPVAISQAHSKHLRLLAYAIDHCGEHKQMDATLTDTGQAGFNRINTIFTREQPPLRIPERCDYDVAESILLMVWSYMLLHPRLTLSRFAMYAEMNVLLEDMLAGGWFA